MVQNWPTLEIPYKVVSWLKAIFRRTITHPEISCINNIEILRKTKPQVVFQNLYCYIIQNMCYSLIILNYLIFNILSEN